VYPLLQEQLLTPIQVPFPEQTVGSDAFFEPQTNTLHSIPVYPLLQLQLFSATQVPFPEQASDVFFEKH
jgi:hypothetical protein